MNCISTTTVEMPDIIGEIDCVDADQSPLAIAEMSERFDVSLRTLRFYEEKGLLSPERRGARRYYGARDINRMRVIMHAKSMGLTLIEICRVVKLVESKKPREEQFEELKSICESQKKMLDEQRQMLEEQEHQVTKFLSELDVLMQA